MQPELPPKPQSNQIGLIQGPPSYACTTHVVHPLETKLDKLAIDDADVDTKRTDLPFKVVSSDLALELFTKKDGDSLNVPIPPYFEYLPNSKIKEFINNEELLCGYLDSLYKEEFRNIKEELDSIIESQVEYAKHLKDKYTNDDYGIVLKTQKLTTDLGNYHRKLKDFDTLQIEMYDNINSVSKPGISEFYHRKIAENEAASAEILKTASEKDGTLETEELNQILSDYINQRHLWHRYKECVCKIDHHKVMGLG